MMKLKIKINRDSLKFLQRGKNFENIFNGVLIKSSKQLGVEIKKIMQETMKSGGWEANEPKYKAWKAASGYSTNPLHRTNLLSNSIAHELKISLPNSIGGEVGWHSGARYSGNLGKRQWTRGVPKRRKSNLGSPDTEVSRFSHSDTNFLAQVAKWNEDGAGQVATHKTEHYSTKNGLTRRGTQKYRIKTRTISTIIRQGRTARPFVAKTREEVIDLVYERYVAATTKAIGRVYGKKTLGTFSDVPS
jgi:hypothetical protein